jgi:hypothetical protein
MADRTPEKLHRVTDPGSILQSQYSDESQVIRGAEAGLNWKPLGALGSKAQVGKARAILLYNSSASVAFVAFGDNTVAAPATAAAGIPILPNDTFICNSGLDQWIIASSASVFGYTAELYDPMGDNL